MTMTPLKNMPNELWEQQPIRQFCNCPEQPTCTECLGRGFALSQSLTRILCPNCSGYGSVLTKEQEQHIINQLLQQIK